jgi:hypothetical protein
MNTKIAFCDIKLITSCEWDRVVSEVYERPYCFQQQEGCRDRGIYHLSVPNKELALEYDNEAFEQIAEIINGPSKRVKFATWLARDPKQPLNDMGEIRSNSWEIELWWDRNFYPDIEVVANDLYSKGILPAGNYIILIDW